jgi:formyltetrahydrofolate synthetase
MWFRRAAPSSSRAVGDMQLMPGLGRTQTFTKIDIDRDGRTVWPY